MTWTLLPDEWRRDTGEPSITRAYGCSQREADGIANPKTAFDKAVRFLGPIRAYKAGGVWTLDQKRADAIAFIEAMRAAQAVAEKRTAAEKERHQRWLLSESEQDARWLKSEPVAKED